MKSNFKILVAVSSALSVLLISLVLAKRPPSQEERSPRPSSKMLSQATDAKARPSLPIQLQQESSKGPLVNLAAEKDLNGKVIQVSHPDLEKTVSLKTKVLRTQAEKDELYDKLGSRPLIQEAKSILQAQYQLPAASISDRNQSLRMNAVEFLSSALNWKENPARQEVIETFRDLLKEEFPQRIGLYRSSIIGDRVELFGALALAEPKEAKALLREVEGTPSEKVYLFALSYFGFKKRI